MAGSERERKVVIDRRGFLRAAAAGTLGLTFGGLLAGCQSSPPASAPASSGGAAPAGAAPTSAPAPAPAPTQAPKIGGTVTVGIGTDPNTLDPQVSGDNEASVLYLMIHDPLFRFDDKGNRVPELAESLQVASDGLSWTAVIRSGIKFHDGTPLNAEAVKKSFERLMDPKAKRDNAAMPEFKSIDVVNENTVRFVTKEPYASFPNALCHQTAALVSPTAAAKLPDDMTNGPVGTSAFKFKDRVRGDRVIMAANLDYWRGRPKIDELVFRTVKEDTTRVMMLEAGDLDVALRVPPTEVERIKANKDITLLVSEGQRIMFLAFNVTRKPFDDIRVRQALNYAVDKEAIVKTILKSSAQVMKSPLAPKAWGYAAVGSYDFNPDKAKQLLKEAGAEGLTVRIASSQGKEPFDRQVAEAVHGQLLAVGVKAQLQVVGDWPTYRTAAEKGEFDLALDAYGIGDGDANKPLSSLLEGKWVGKSGTRNYSQYANPKFDKLLESARGTMDEKARMQLYADAQKLILDDAPWIFLHTNNSYHAVRNTVQGAILPANDKIDLRFVSKR